MIKFSEVLVVNMPTNPLLPDNVLQYFNNKNGFFRFDSVRI